MKHLKEISLSTQSCYSAANHFLCQPSLHLQSKCISKPRINHIWQFSEPQPVVISCLFFASTSECWLYFKTFELQRVMEAGGYKRRLKIYCPWSMIHTRGLVWAPVYHCWNLGGNKACSRESLLYFPEIFFFHDWQNSVFKNILTCIKSLNWNWIKTDLGMLTINYWLIAIKNLPDDIKLLRINWKSRGASVLCQWKLNHEGLHVLLHDLRKQGGGVLASPKQEAEILLHLMTAIKMPQSGLTVSQ